MKNTRRARGKPVIANKELMDLVETITSKRTANLTVTQFATITGLAPRTVRLECASGRLPAYQSHVGAPYLIFYTHLEKYMQVSDAA